MTKNELQSLFSRPERSNATVLSVYLNVDQSRQANLNRGFETELNDLAVSIRQGINDPLEAERFDRAMQHVSDFAATYRPHARMLAMFFDTVDGFFWHQEFDLHVESTARWNRAIFSQPLANAVDQFEQYGVVLADRTTVRLFAAFLGEIQEDVRKDFGPARTRHIKTTGTDHIGSASQLQRKADEQVRSNLRQAVALVETFVQNRKLNRLILAGTTEVTSALQGLLPKGLSRIVIGTVNLPINATPRDVLQAVEPVAIEYERRDERKTVEEVVTIAAKSDKAVVGLDRVLEAVNFNRAWRLVYVDGLSAPGFECTQCAALFASQDASCSYCGGAVNAEENVVALAVEQAVRKGAIIEVVSRNAAASLQDVGGIGVLLKTRTA
jgi:peptide subunit release factor 1 (eRF1)